MIESSYGQSISTTEIWPPDGNLYGLRIHAVESSINGTLLQKRFFYSTTDAHQHTAHVGVRSIALAFHSPKVNPGQFTPVVLFRVCVL